MDYLKIYEELIDSKNYENKIDYEKRKQDIIEVERLIDEGIPEDELLEFYNELCQQEADEKEFEKQIEQEKEQKYESSLFLIDIFTIYYNKTYNTNGNIIESEDKIMLLRQIISEYKSFMEKFYFDENDMLGLEYNSYDEANIFDTNVYKFQYQDNIFYSPCLLVCFNHIYSQNIINNDWTIITMKIST